MEPKRRDLLQAGAGLVVLAFAPRGLAAMPVLEETHPDAVALNYVADASKVNREAHPEFVPGNRCAGCFFFHGRGAAATAPCTVFAGYRVNANGWCREFKERPS